MVEGHECHTVLEFEEHLPPTKDTMNDTLKNCTMLYGLNRNFLKIPTASLPNRMKWRAMSCDTGGCVHVLYQVSRRGIQRLQRR